MLRYAEDVIFSSQAELPRLMMLPRLYASPSPAAGQDILRGYATPPFFFFFSVCHRLQQVFFFVRCAWQASLLPV